MFGLDNPGIDVEIILLGQHIFQQLGMADKIKCQINSIGDQQAQDTFARHWLTTSNHMLNGDVFKNVSKKSIAHL